jgi:hypothetical protein
MTNRAILAVAALATLAAGSANAAQTCEGKWTPGCTVLTYDGIAAGYCAQLLEVGDTCHGWQVTPYGEEIDNKRTAALPTCPKGLGLGEISERHLSCKIPASEIELVPMPGGFHAD